MKLHNFVAGLNILNKYYTDKTGYHLGAEHDQIYLYATDIPVSETDVKALAKLGWFQEGIDFYEGGMYNHEESWSCFV